VLAYHEEAPLVAANLFSFAPGGRCGGSAGIFIWEDPAAFDAQEFW